MSRWRSQSVKTVTGANFHVFVYQWTQYSGLFSENRLPWKHLQVLCRLAPPGGPIPLAGSCSVSRASFTHTVAYFPALDVLSSLPEGPKSPHLSSSHFTVAYSVNLLLQLFTVSEYLLKAHFVPGSMVCSLGERKEVWVMFLPLGPCNPEWSPRHTQEIKGMGFV